MSRIFINYRRQDSEGYVGRLYDHLSQQFDPSDIFMDVEAMKPGVDFVKVLEDAVLACDVFIAIIGPQWLDVQNEAGTRRLDEERDFVRIEIESALKHNKLVIPVLVGRAAMPGTRDLPKSIAALARRNAFELSHQRFAYDAEQLAQTIKTAIVPVNPSSKPRASSETLRRKMRELKNLRDQLFDARTSPLYAYRIENRYFPVLGDGSPDANILFIGQGPGEYEAMQGIPFVGASGDVLDEMLLTIGLKREDTYITNIIHDRTPDNRDPIPAEIEFYAPYVDKVIEIIQPGVIVPLGRFSMGYILRKYDLPEKRMRIGQLHGKLLQSQAKHGNIFILPIYHPAMVLYSARERDTLRQDFQQLKPFV
ncbi:MAG: TIR domain-containing protein [Anaerolineae bacterium]|nr:TIR domain-containing protein [Anaerolineae bacterium]